MRLTRAAAYAIRATMILADSDATLPVPCSQLASQGNMPERFLLQILRSLVTGGILQSTRGVVGGYRLGRPSDEISLLEVIEAIDGPLETRIPVDGEWTDPSRTRLTKILERVNSTTREQLEAISLATLVRQTSHGMETSALLPATPLK